MYSSIPLILSKKKSLREHLVSPLLCSWSQCWDNQKERCRVRSQLGDEVCVQRYQCDSGWPSLTLFTLGFHKDTCVHSKTQLIYNRRNKITNTPFFWGASVTLEHLHWANIRPLCRVLLGHSGPPQRGRNHLLALSPSFFSTLLTDGLILNLLMCFITLRPRPGKKYSFP